MKVRAADRRAENSSRVVVPLREGKLCLTSIVELARVFPHVGAAGQGRVVPGPPKEWFRRRNHDMDVAFRPLPMRVEPVKANDSRLHMTVSSRFLEKLEAAPDLLLAKQSSRRAEVAKPQR